ncbi:MAG: hypothetical protein RLZZ123_579, partial [Pseudomonadota bacterium]
MLDDAADVVQGKIAQPGIAIACEQVFAALPDRLVNVHARTVVTDQGLWHEGRGFAIGVGHVPHHILQLLGPIGTLDQGAELGADFVLTSACHLVVEHFNGDAHFFEDQNHLGTHVLGAVDRGHGEVATLDRGAMATVATFEFGARVPGGLVFFNFEESTAH